MKRHCWPGLLLAYIGFFSGCAPDAPRESPRGRSVILFIGDGLGATQTTLALQYASLIEERELNIEKLMKQGNVGLSLPWPYASVVTDSAAAATQMATGDVVRNETLGLSPDGYPIETLLEWAKARGLKTGLVTNMRLSHATPAGFGAHQISRYSPEADILDDIFGQAPDVLLGGGARGLIPSGHRVSEFLASIPDELDGASNRRDDSNRIAEAQASGYAVVSDVESLRAALTGEEEKILGLFSATHLPYVLDRRILGLDTVPPLAEMAKAAIDTLGRSDQGFFLMIEGGRIDYAGHDNDAGTLLHEILDFDAAVGEALAFQDEHPETLVIVTADHGTGGFSFTYGDFGTTESEELPSGLVYHSDHRYPGKEQLQILFDQKASYLQMLERSGLDPQRLIEVVREHTGMTLTMQEAELALVRDDKGLAWMRESQEFYGDTDSNPACLLGRALARQTFVVWSTGGHTVEPIPTYGRGPGAERLRGLFPNTEIYRVMRATLQEGDATE